MSPSQALPAPYLEESCDVSQGNAIPYHEHMYDLAVTSTIQELGYRMDCLEWICSHQEEVCGLCDSYVQAIQKDIERAGISPELQKDLVAAEQDARNQEKNLDRNHQVLCGLERNMAALKSQQLDYYAGVLTQRQYVSVRLTFDV
jgi:hypothetical protein